MVKYFLLIISLVLSCLPLSAIDVEVSTYRFTGKTRYVEVYFRVTGNSVKWKSLDSVRQASVQVVYYVKDKDEKILAWDKFILNKSVTDSIVDFITVKRMALPAGNYTLRVETTDMNNTEDKLEMEKILVLEPPSGGVILSDLMLLSALEKTDSEGEMVRGGYYMEPMAFSFAGPKVQALNLYQEVYRPQSDSAEYFVRISLYEGFGIKDEKTPLMSKFRKLSVSPVEPLILSLPINSVRSGNYHVSVSIIDKHKNVLSSCYADLVRSNPEADIAYLENYNEDLENSFVRDLKGEDMDFILKAHLPVTPQNQVSTLGELISGKRLASQRQFVFQFWKNRYPENPEAAYKKYMEVAQAVDRQFQTNAGYGFQSDRGHIFLKYGKPTNVLTIDTEVDAPPYEIWYYYHMAATNQTNVRFLFYNPSLVHNDFRLLHSTCLGERSNPAWETELYKSVPRERLGNTVDATQVADNKNRNARRYFNEF